MTKEERRKIVDKAVKEAIERVFGKESKERKELQSSLDKQFSFLKPFGKSLKEYHG